MKLAGDVPQEDRKLAEELEKFEREIDQDPFSGDRKAQLYTCLAHDWFKLGAEEEGNRLLLKADQVSPGYFNKTVIQHQLEDESFDLIVKNITLELAQMLAENILRDCQEKLKRM